MAKRIPLSERRERDVRGTDVIFGGAPTPQEPATPQEAPAVTATPQKPATLPAPESVAAGKAALSKVTLYIRPDQVIAIETIQLQQRQATGNKPDKSDLVQEALDLLTQKYGLK